MIALYKAIFILCASHITHFSHNTREVTYMDYKILATVFAAVFIAELCDKTHLATLLFAADEEVSKLTVFAGASLALIAATGISVLAGGLISQYASEKTRTTSPVSALY